MLRKAAVVLDSRPVALKESGDLTLGKMKQINPDAQIVSVSDFGDTGPYKDFRASDGREHLRHVRRTAYVLRMARHPNSHNPHAMLKDVVTIEEIVNSPIISMPLHRLDCCVVPDGGGAVVVAHPDIALTLRRQATPGPAPTGTLRQQGQRGCLGRPRKQSIALRSPISIRFESCSGHC